MDINNTFKGFYKDTKVLVTGHTGFKGSWLTTWLVELGARVVGYSLEPPTNPNMFTALKLEKKIRHIIGDVRDLAHLSRVFKDEKPDAVFHLAAQPIVRLSYSDPVTTYDTNVMGTVNVLECIRMHQGVSVCVIVTTDKCYENREWVFGYRENDPLGGVDPYSSSKACSEHVTAAYRHSFFNKNDFGVTHQTSIASVRAGNVIGGGDWSVDRLIPDCMRSLTEGKNIILRNPGAIRPWQLVLEPLSGYLWLGALMGGNGAVYSDSWNFGPDLGNTVTVGEIAEMVVSIWGSGRVEVNSDRQPHEAKLLRLDISKAHSILGWNPVYEIGETVKRTVSWYKEYEAQGGRMYDYSVAQINEYIDAAKKTRSKWCEK